MAKAVTALDKSQVPDELSIALNPIEVASILKLAPTAIVEFSYGDFVPNAHAFNTFLEANVTPGVTKKLTRNRVIHLIKQLAMDLNSGGLNTLSMICLGKGECPRYADCSIVKSGEPAPVSLPCPLEKMEALNHVRGLASDFGEGRTYADQLMIQGVAGVEMLKTRVYATMSSMPDSVIEVGKGTDNSGNAIFDKVENPNFKILSSLLKQEQLLLKGLHLTQEQRLKIDGGKSVTADVLIADLKGAMQKLAREHKTNGLEIQDATILSQEAKGLQDLKDTTNERVQNTTQHFTDGQGKDRPGTSPESFTKVSDTARDITASLGDIPTAKGDFGSLTKQQRRTEPNLSQPVINGRSPFEQDTFTGSDANSMDEAE